MENEKTAKSELTLALVRVQGAIVNPKKDTANPFFKSKYADLAGVWDSVRSLLSENGLVFLQLPTTDDNRVSVTARLMHVSGESIESTITGTATDAKPQSIGSCITYLRRYQMSAILGIAAEDDDGNAASGNDAAPKQKTAKQAMPTFAGAVPFEKHLAEQEAKAAPAGQVDHGSFEDKIKSAIVAQQGKTGSGRPWTLYKIETEGHGEFSTFEADLFEAARAAIELNHFVMVDSEPTPKGAKIVGIRYLVEESA